MTFGSNVQPPRFGAGAGNPTRMHCPDCNKLIPASDITWHREQLHPSSTIEMNPASEGSVPPKD